MDDLEARVKCIEVAAQMNRATGDHSPTGVVNTAMLLYTFVKASSSEENQPEPADKPKQKVAKAKAIDILS